MKRQNLRKTLQIFSLLFFPLTIFYFSPYLSVVGAYKGMIVGSVVTFGLLFLFSLFFGRSFCAWLCPAGGLHEVMTLAKDKPFRAAKAKKLKFIIWVPWFTAIIIGFITAGGMSEFRPFYRTYYGMSLHSWYGYLVYILMISIIFITSLTVGKRTMCHTFCWMAPFMILGGRLGKLLRLPQWGISGDSDKCIGCKRCNKTCSMSLDIMNMVQNDNCVHDDCIQCGACVDVCPKKAIELKVQKRK